jgi:hypothetical protein
MLKQLFAITMIVLSFSCSSTKLTTVWKDPKLKQTQYQRIIIVGLMDGIKNRELRERVETHIAEDLNKLGYSAQSAYQTYGPRSFSEKKEEDVINLLRKDGYDAVVTIAVIDIEKEKNYVQGYVDFWPGGIYYSRFGRYYYYWHNRIYQPGYYVTNTTYVIEGNLFDTRLDKLVFSAQTESVDPGTIDALGHRFSQTLIRSMKDKSVL